MRLKSILCGLHLIVKVRAAGGECQTIITGCVALTRPVSVFAVFQDIFELQRPKNVAAVF